MPSVESMGRYQKAVLWAAVGHDRNGKITVSAAAEIDVRWEEGKREAPGETGEPVAYDAMVMVDQAVTIDSLLWKGALADLPVSMTNVFRVASVEDVPDLKGRNTQRTLMLVRWGNTLPTIV